MDWNFDNLGKMKGSRRELHKSEKSGKGGCWLKLDQDGWCKYSSSLLVSGLWNRI